ncbi:inhibitory synaptic factor 1 [Neopelma chrysocephalum]|uniref:inhibitory synaptic factor 1 n=1 Tax=Neopelma chrysocephalum TaxID=114329 RepID=UPI000FCD30CA|nr:inhibitory synaptic factor 1 [Neopelma chrysocephalum]XP_027553889.1 inhibitory synaptic factor 1 [Neopelma chrysocephalum]XP_027553890.1 inhibitory synaptic factor 1 [Neopelma chrysocephalum]XP_027553891.1 inhibitory synaptic factor 1 [Neopelma chrysocephalum]
MDSRTCQDRQPSDHPSSSSSNCSSSKSNCERERIRSRMKMVIGQLEGILQELKEVAKELREVVSQIDRLTSDFEFDLEPDDWTTATASSTSSSDKGGGTFELGPLDFAASDILSDSWEFCSFLDASTPSDPGDGPEPPRPQPQPPPARQPDYRLMNGGLPIPNGPRGGGTPDSSSEEAFGTTSSLKLSQHRPAGTRERVRFSDKVLYHALCCDDDRDGDSTASPGDEGPEEPGRKVPVGPSKHPNAGGGAAPGRRLMRNSSTQTVADKSTQTVLPYIPAKQRIKNKN